MLMHASFYLCEQNVVSTYRGDKESKGNCLRGASHFADFEGFATITVRGLQRIVAARKLKS